MIESANIMLFDTVCIKSLSVLNKQMLNYT